MVKIAFNAGAIEATLTLDRSPFTAGLKAARAQATKFSEDKIQSNVTTNVKMKLAEGAAKTLRETIAKINGTAEVKLKFAEGAVTELREKIAKVSGTANVKLQLDKDSIVKLKESIGKLFGTANVRLKLDKDSVAKLKESISTINGTANVDVVLAKAKIARAEAQIKAALARENVAEIGVQIKEAQLRTAEERLRQLEDKGVVAEVDFAIKYAKLQEVEQKVRQLEAKSAQIPIDFDLKTAALLKAEEMLLQLEMKRAQIPIDFELKTAKLLEAEERITQLEMRRPEIQIDIDFKAGKLLMLEEQLAQLEARRPEIAIDFDIKTAKLLYLEEKMLQLEMRRPEIEIDFDIKQAKLALLQAQLLRLATTETNHRVNITGNGSARMKAILLLVAAFAPAIGSAIVGVTGLVLALVSALGSAAAGLAAFGAVGFSVFNKINNYAKDSAAAMQASVAASDALASAQSRLATTVENAKRSQAQAARQVEDAERAVADAVEAAAQSQINAARRVESAERNVASSKRALTNAQEDLTRAIRDTREEMEDLALSLRGGALAEEQAVLDLAEAQERLAAARAEGVSGNDLKQLELDVKRAALGIDEARERYGDLKEQSDEFARTGVNGARNVRDANQAVSDATQGVSDAERELSDARAEAARDAIQGSRNIADAQRALDDARADAAQATIDAQRDIAEAQKDVAKAAAAAAEAQRNQVEALTPALARAEQALQSVKKAYEDLVKRTQDPVADAFTANFKAAETFLKTLDPIVVAVAKQFEIIGGQIDKYFSSDHWKDFVGFLDANAGPAVQQFFDIFAYGTRAVMEIIEAFDPLADRVLPAIAAGLRDFANWLDEVSKTPQFKEFLDLAAESLKAFWDWLVAVIKFIWDLSIALAPLGNAMFDFFTKVFDGLSKLPPPVLAAVATGLFGIMAALILGASAPVALGIAALYATAAAMANLYENNETVRNAVDKFVQSLKDNFGPVFERLSDLFEQRVVPAFEKVRETVAEKLWPAFERFLIAVQPFVAFFTEVVGVVLIDIFERFVHVIDGLLQMLSGFFDTFSGLLTGDWELFWNGLKDIGEGALNTFLGIFNTSLDDIDEDVATWSEGFKAEWDKHWTFVSDTVAEHNRLIDEKWRETLGDISEALGFQRPTLETEWDKMWKKLEELATTTWTRLQEGWNAHWGLWQTTFNNESTSMSTGWSAFWDGVSAKANEVWDLLGIDWTGFWEGITGTAEQKQNERSTSWVAWLTGMAATALLKWNEITTTIQNALTIMGTYLDQATARFNDAWGKIGNIFANPINWVINTVLNDGILKSWNTVMGWIGQPQLSVQPAPNIPLYNPSTQKFAEGGKVTGGIPNKDSVQALLMPGEYVLSKRAIQNMGGLGQVEQIHQAARAGSVVGLGATRNDGLARQHLMRTRPLMDDGNLYKYAYGGVQPHVARAGQEIERIFGRLPGGIGGVGARANASDHPSGHALDFMTMTNKPLGDRISAHLQANAAQLLVKYLIWQQQINSGSGWKGMEDRGSPTANHLDHVHASFLRAGEAGRGMGGGAAAGAAQEVSWWSLLGSQVTSLFNGLMPKAIPGIGGPIGSSMLNIPKAAIAKTIEAAEKKLSALMTTIFGGAGKDAGSGPGSGPVVDQVRAVANRYGWGEGPQWDALSRLIQKESSWNPNAQNPTSTAYGLFQFLNSTWATVGAKKTSNPGLQAEAGLKYIAQRYSTPSGALAFHNKNNYYDTGGMLMPGVSPVNTTGQAERILSPQQTGDFERLVSILEALVGSDGVFTTSQGDVINLNIYLSDKNKAIDILEEANFQLKGTKRGGLYK